MTMAHIAQRAFNTPLLIDAAKAQAILAGLGGRIVGGKLRFEDAGDRPEPARTGTLTADVAERVIERGGRAYRVVDGVAVIEVTGTLVHRGAWIGNSSGVTSYEGLSSQLDAAAADSSVRGIALEIDSHGGEASGAFDLADRIRSISKPVWAFVSEHAYSGGYIIASQADRIILPRTGGVGSIGVAVLHADFSGQLEQDGVQVTMIHSGRHKVDGNPYEPLPREVAASIQAEIDEMRGMFAETVAAGRGDRFTTGQALATEAQTYRGAEAVRLGLADEVSDVRSAFARFVSEVSGRSGGRIANQRRSVMASAEGRDEAVVTMAEAEAMVQAAVSVAAEGEQARTQAAIAEAMAARDATEAADRERRAAIMSHPEAAGREALASALADAGMTAEAAGAALAAAPKSYSAQMDETGGAGVRHEEEAGEESPTKGATKARPAKTGAADKVMVL